ncbi:TLC ATP/ADP transporter [Fragilaria crotonensis]|nr:TLC ATP/ADP transporter [Fragilaria crotonensis]
MVRMMQCLGVAILAALNSRGNAFTAVPHLAIGLHMSVGTSMGFKSPIAHRGRTGKRLGMSSTASAPEEEKKGFIGRFKAGIPPAEERKKLIPLAVMFFCILFNYTVLRDTKDVLLVTAPKSGAEVIPFLKTYCNLPSAIGFAALYSKLCDRMEQRNVFYAIVIPFLIFFASFALVIYPNNAFLHPHALVDKIALLLPAGASAPLAIVRTGVLPCSTSWQKCGKCRYIIVVLGFANEVTTVEEAKKYYPLFGLGANVALIFSGQYVRWVSGLRAGLGPGADPWAVSLRYLMGAVVASGGVLVATYTWMLKNVIKDKPVTKAAAKKKVKMTLRVCNLPYELSIHSQSGDLSDRLAFPNPNDYSAFMGNFSSAMGTVTLFMMLIGRAIFQRFGWRTAAMVTPSMIGFTGLAFFALNMLSGSLGPVAAMFGTTPLMLAVFVGAIQNILSKSTKYSLFDPCKEMAYIPLDQESKTKGKAAIDVVGNPLGKSGGAMIQQILIFGVGSLAAATPYLAAILGGLVFLWLRAANSLATQFEEAMKAPDAA